MAIEPPFCFIESQRRSLLPPSSSSLPSLPSSSSSASLFPLPHPAPGPCAGFSSLAPAHETVISIDRTVSRSASFRPSRVPTLDDGRELQATSRASAAGPAMATSNNGSSSSSGRRLSLMSSGFWVSVELFFTISQILAAVLVLALSQNERPETPLPVWVIGYAAGCAATLPLLYWRYAHHPSIELLEHDPLALQHQALWPPTNTMPVSHPVVSQLDASVPNATIGGRAYHGFSRGSGNIRIEVCMERLRMSLDCFFAVWFVLGNVWVFGRPSSAEESPKLYRLCVAFLALSCVSYAMPFVLCAAVCCCLPCVITLLGFRENQVEGRGATADVIAALPIYKFRSKRIQFCREEDKFGNESDSDSSSEGGVMGAGTENERVISGDDAACCICLGRYKDNAQLRGLPCLHHFHVECVDQWLKINASCPLCKFSLQGGKCGDGDADALAAGGARRGRRLFEEV